MEENNTWATYYEPLFRLKLKRKELEQYLNKIERMADLNLSSLHHGILHKYVTLKNNYIPHIKSCELWLENYLTKQRSIIGDNIPNNDCTIINMHRWVNEYVTTCLNNQYCILNEIRNE